MVNSGYTLVESKVIDNAKEKIFELDPGNTITISEVKDESSK
jgi:hypothetical protein